MGKDEELSLAIEMAKFGTKVEYMQRDISETKETQKQITTTLSQLSQGMGELKADVENLSEDITKVNNKADKLQTDLTAHDIRDQQSVWTKSIGWLGGMNLIQIIILVGALGTLAIVGLVFSSTYLGRDHTAEIIKQGMTHGKEVVIKNGEIKQ